LLSIVTIIAILCSTVLENTAWIDSIGGLGISVIMLRAAVTSSIEAMSFLVSS
jgi:divalent metal cation (Fe/Co/Zn/Cd) transporter